MRTAFVSCCTCLLLLGALTNCSAGSGEQTTAAPSATTATTERSTTAESASVTIEVSSSAFEPGGTIPQQYAGEGQNISPPVQWSGLPEGTRELALICDDPDAPRPTPFVHWVVYKIPATLRGFPEGSTQGAIEGTNDAGRTGYSGPMPPVGSGVHHYHFRVYALDEELGAAAGLTKDQLLEAMEGHILGEGELVGTYERK